MLERTVEGEQEEFAKLRGSLVKLCDMEHFNKVMAILKRHAKSNGVNMQTAMYIWEKAQCPDLTVESGMRQYNRVYDREMSVL